MEHSIIETKSEYEKLIEEIYRLKDRIVTLTAFRDDLLYHVCPALEIEYEEKIAGLERELMVAYLYLNTYRRTIELLQAQVNSRRKSISVEEAEEQAVEAVTEKVDTLVSDGIAESFADTHNLSNRQINTIYDYRSINDDIANGNYGKIISQIMQIY